MTGENITLSSNEDIIQNAVGQKMKHYGQTFSLLDKVRVPDEESKTLVAFMDQKKTIRGAYVYDNMEPHELDKDVLVKAAHEFKSRNLEIVTRYGHVPHDKLVFCTSPNATATAFLNALNDPQRVAATVKFAQELGKADIAVADILLTQYKSAMSYARNVSESLFAGYYPNLYWNSLDKISVKYRNYQEVCESTAPCRPSKKHDHLYLVMLNNKKEALSNCEVEPMHYRFIPGLLEEKGYLFDRAFKEAKRRKPAAIMAIQHIQDRGDGFAATEDDFKIFHALRDKAAEYGVNLHDYVLYNDKPMQPPYESHYVYNKSLSFAKKYGL